MACSLPPDATAWGWSAVRSADGWAGTPQPGHQSPCVARHALTVSARRIRSLCVYGLRSRLAWVTLRDRPPSHDVHRGVGPRVPQSRQGRMGMAVKPPDGVGRRADNGAWWPRARWADVCASASTAASSGPGRVDHLLVDRDRRDRGMHCGVLRGRHPGRHGPVAESPGATSAQPTPDDVPRVDLCQAGRATCPAAGGGPDRMAAACSVGQARAAWISISSRR